MAHPEWVVAMAVFWAILAEKANLEPEIVGDAFLTTVAAIPAIPEVVIVQFDAVPVVAVPLLLLVCMAVVADCAVVLPSVLAVIFYVFPYVHLLALTVVC
uniref:Putative calphotin n=1 Tax=Anopheles darlingi TaxID=43151 RepID=A0A2M4DRP9_ANODA